MHNLGCFEEIQTCNTVNWTALETRPNVQLREVSVLKGLFI